MKTLTETKRNEPNQTEPNQTKPNRTEPNRTEPNRTEPNRTEPNRLEPNQTGQGQTESNRPEPRLLERATHPFRLHELHLLADEVVLRLRQNFVQVFFAQPLELNADRQPPLKARSDLQQLKKHVSTDIYRHRS